MHADKINFQILAGIWVLVHKPYDVKETADKILAEMKGIAEELNIPFFLYAGTCLGFVRGGQYIEWDDDIDIGVLCDPDEEGHRPQFVKLRERLERAGYRAGTCGHGGHGGGQAFIKNDIVIGVFFEYDDCILPFLKSFEKIEHHGEIYNVPHPVDGYLTTMYGNWRVPSRE